MVVLYELTSAEASVVYIVTTLHTVNFASFFGNYLADFPQFA